MRSRKNTKVGKVSINFFIIFLIIIFLITKSYSSTNDLEGNSTSIKVLDKISSKNVSLELKNGENIKYADLQIRSIRCRHSEFDDDPEITAYVQVKDLSNKKNDEVFVFNGWMFSSSPSINPFDHPVYDIWLTDCN